MVPIADNGGLDAFACHMISHLDLAPASSLEEVDGGVVLFIPQLVHLVVLLDDSLLGVAKAITKAHQDAAEEGLVPPLALIFKNVFAGGRQAHDLTLGECDLGLVFGDQLHCLLDDVVLLLQRLHEHCGAHSDLQTRRKLVEELLQLSLAHLGVARALEEFTDLILQILVQTDVRHGHISVIDLFLLRFRLGADLGDQYCQLTENIRLENGSRQVDHHHEDELRELLGAHFIASDDEH